MISKKTFVLWWICGLVAFAISIYLHNPLNIDGVPGGILDHQAAPDAQAVNAIHDAWKSAGVFNQVALAMISDLIFIQIYSLGAILGGMYFRSRPGAALRVIGGFVLAAGVIFYVTDVVETGSQLTQVIQDAGSDNLAYVASTMQPIKTFTFLVTFFGIIAALLVERFKR